jgi:hypothetical protein
MRLEPVTIRVMRHQVGDPEQIVLWCEGCSRVIDHLGSAPVIADVGMAAERHKRERHLVEGPVPPEPARLCTWPLGGPCARDATPDERARAEQPGYGPENDKPPGRAGG